MELTYIKNVVRRYWPIVVVCMMLGTAGLYALKGTAKPVYQSQAVLLLRPPSSQGIGVSSDRYVAGQISVLRSERLATEVSASLKGAIGTEDITKSLIVASSTTSDVVAITISAQTPQQAKQIADAYVAVYFDDLQADATKAAESASKQVDSTLQNVDDRIVDVDNKIAAALAPYLRNASSTAVIPTIDQVSPDLASQKAELQAQYNDIRAKKTALDLGAQASVTSQIIQPATLPTFATVASKKLFLAAGFIGGGFVGLVLAVVIARLSPRILDEEHVAEILGKPVVFRFPNDRRLSADRRRMLHSVPREARPFVDRLCARTEASARARPSLTVAVMGTQRGAGATTLASAIAIRYLAAGASVLLIDADLKAPSLSEILSAEDSGLSHVWEPPSPRKASSKLLVRSPPGTMQGTPTGIANLSFLGLGHSNDADALRHHDVEEMIDVVATHHDVVIFDGGALLETASSIRLARAVDFVVLAVPIARERTANLRVVGRQLSESAGEVLPIATPMGRRSAQRLFRRRTRSIHSPSSLETAAKSAPEVEGDAGSWGPPTRASARVKARRAVVTGSPRVDWEADEEREGAKSGLPH